MALEVIESVRATRPDVALEIVDVSLAPEVAVKYGVTATPAIAINGRLAIRGVPAANRSEIVDTIRFLSDILGILPSSLRRVRRSLIRGSRALNHLTHAELEQCVQENYQWLLQVRDRDDAPYRFGETIHRLRLAFSQRYVYTVRLG